MLNQVAILAGGMGTRLKSRTGDFPKPMALIMGKPVLEHQIDLCKSHGLIKIALLVHHQSEIIKNYFGDGSRWGVHLTYIVENVPRGTAGALRDSLDVMEDRFFVLYADTYADVNLSKMKEVALERDCDGVLLLHPNDHPSDSDLVEIDASNYILSIHGYPHDKSVDHRNMVNAALYFFKKTPLSISIPQAGKYDLAKDIFPKLLRDGLSLFGYVTPEYIKDMGTPERLDRVETDINNGLPEALSSRQLRSAVFFDRDGTLNHEVNHLKAPDQLILLDGVSEAVRRVNRAGLLAIGITNQPVLARGDVTTGGMEKIHARLDSLLGNGGAYLDRVYVCPHHPDGGFSGEVPELKINCNCRKPEAGLFDLAVRELNISRRDSWMVGDTTADILAGKRAGLRTILVNTGYAGRDFKYDVSPDFIAPTLSDAVDWILGGHANATEKLMPIALSAINCRAIMLGGASRSGKSTVANVMVEIFNLIGKKAHVLPLDGWLKSAEERRERTGVLNRYRLNEIIHEAKKVVSSPKRISVEYTQYDRKLKVPQLRKTVSIGPADIVIFEGVPALLDKQLLELSDLSICVDIDDSTRMKRLKEEYYWRGEDEEFFMKKIMSREMDEVALIKESAHKADHQINLEYNNDCK